MSFGRTIKGKTINAYHAAAVTYLFAGVGLGAALSGHASPDLHTGGWFLLHAQVAFMGFGTLLVLGHQHVLAPHVRACWDGHSGAPAPATPGLLAFFNAALWMIWGMFLARAFTGDNAYLIGAMAGCALALAGLCVVVKRLFGGISPRTLRRNMPARFLLTAMFICFLAYGQLFYISLCVFFPQLPFSKTMLLRVNYLAFSFPLSLTVMATIQHPFARGLADGRIKTKWLWEAQYVILVSGVFSLFFSLVFDSPHFHDVYTALQGTFSGILFLSIAFLSAAMIKDRARVKDPPREIWRYYVSAVAYLFLCGAGGFLLGYGWDKHSNMYYFLIQIHVHLALLGWIGMGMTGVVYYLLHLGGREPGARGAANFALMHAGVWLMAAGIWFKSMPLRVGGGASVAAAVALLCLAMREEFKKN